MYTAATLTITSLVTRLASVLEGSAGDCRGMPALWQRDTRPQATSD